MKEFIVDVEADELEDEDKVVEFTLIDRVPDGVETDPETGEEKPKFKETKRVLKANMPTTGQMTFLLATTGRGQSNQSRFAGIVNVMLSCLEPEDADYFEERLVARERYKRIGMKQVESIFEHLTTEWFGNPTDES